MRSGWRTATPSTDHPDVAYPDVRVWPTEASIAEYDYALDTVNLWGWAEDGTRWYLTPWEWRRPDWEGRILAALARILSHEYIHKLLNALEGQAAMFGYDDILDEYMQGAFG